MDTKTATNILIQAAAIGQAKGAYTLQDAKNIALAVEVLYSSSKRRADSRT